MLLVSFTFHELLMISEIKFHMWNDMCIFRKGLSAILESPIENCLCTFLYNRLLLSCIIYACIYSYILYNKSILVGCLWYETRIYVKINFKVRILIVRIGNSWN